MKCSTIISLVIAAFSIAGYSQVPASVQLQILKAEDARRYDKPLEALLKNANEQVRIRAALAAGRIGDEAAVTPLLNLLEKDPSIDVRTMAAFALGEIESISAADGIIDRIRGVKEKEVQLTLGRAKTGEEEWTVANPMARLVEAAGKIAAANPTNKKSDELREVLLSHLEAHKTPGPSEDRMTVRLALTGLLRSAPRDAKRTRPDPTDVVLARFLTHAYEPVRADAANALARLRAKNANVVLRTMAESDPYPIARANAARALGAAEDKDAIDLLIKAAISDTDSRVRVSAIRSLAALKDAKAAEPLLKRGEIIFAAYKKAWKPTFIPNEHSEFLEIATTLGRLLTNTRDERAVNLFREFGKLDRGFSPEVYIARLRISPGHGDDDNKPDLTHWKQYSTLAQVVGEFSAVEPTNEEGKRMKTEAPDILRPLASAYAEADPVKDADTIKAGPDVLQAFARFKTNDLGEIARRALQNKDVQIRVTAAGILGDLPFAGENVEALTASFTRSLLTDKKENDAQLAIIDAVFKLNKMAAARMFPEALAYQDYLVRKKAMDLLKDRDAWKDVPAAEMNSLHQLAATGKDTVWPYAPKSGTRLGQVLNIDVDYRRALSRKNGAVKAVLTTGKGTFTIDLMPEDAPLTVDNFIKLARANYFNGVEVHRVVPNFVMQDGDPRGDGNGGPGWSIRCEMNMVPYERGAVGMALSGKDTGGSQWFVTHAPQPHLDGGYTVFGRVNETAMKVVDQIVRGDKIVSVRIVEGISTQRSRSTRRR